MKICSQCGKEMIVRVAKQGANPGKLFLGCTGFPNCKYTEELFDTSLIQQPPTSPETIHKIIYELSFRLYEHSQHPHFSDEILNGLILQLHFTDYKNFYIWILNEMTKYNPHQMHNHLQVGSPYCFALVNIIKSIKDKLDITEMNILQDDIFYLQTEHPHRIIEWKELINRN